MPTFWIFRSKSSELRSHFSPTRLVRAHLAFLCFRQPESLTTLENLLLLGLHGAALVYLFRYLELPLEALALFLAILVVTILGPLRERYSLSFAILGALFFFYASGMAYFAYKAFVHPNPPGYIDHELVDWRVPLLHRQGALLSAVIYCALCLAYVLSGSRKTIARWSAIAVVVAASGWAAAQYVGHRTRGATASDPYVYVQMGIDLANRGTPAHRFHLFPEIKDQSIAWDPIIHVGYRLPGTLKGDAVSVWPIGGAFAYAAAFRLFGEQALYLVNPFFSLLSALAAGILAWELSQGASRALRLLVSALVCGIVATGNEQVSWSIVTMVDAQAELFTVLALYAALRARRDSRLPWPILAGVSLAAAYWVRHTQLVLAPSLALLLTWRTGPVRERLRAILVCGGAAMIVALPDLWYHQAFLGNWLRPESEELQLFSMAAIGDTANRLYERASAGYEFGWLAPFAIYGAVQLARRERIQFWALAGWVLLSLALHLPYAALRLRDLLPEFPAIAFVASYGIVRLVEQLLRARRPLLQLVASIVIFGSIQLLVLRVWNTIPRIWQPTVPAFGYMAQSHRTAFDQLAAITPPDAVIGSMLNDGAIDLYSQRATFRPAAWTSAELREFLDIMSRNHSSIYLLDDSGAIESVLDNLRRDWRLEFVTTLDVPLFAPAPRQPGTLWRVIPHD